MEKKTKQSLRKLPRGSKRKENKSVKVVKDTKETMNYGNNTRTQPLSERRVNVLANKRTEDSASTILDKYNYIKGLPEISVIKIKTRPSRAADRSALGPEGRDVTNRTLGFNCTHPALMADFSSISKSVSDKYKRNKSSKPKNDSFFYQVLSTVPVIDLVSTVSPLHVHPKRNAEAASNIQDSDWRPGRNSSLEDDSHHTTFIDNESDLLSSPGDRVKQEEDVPPCFLDETIIIEKFAGLSLGLNKNLIELPPESEWSECFLDSSSPAGPIPVPLSDPAIHVVNDTLISNIGTEPVKNLHSIIISDSLSEDSNKSIIIFDFNENKIISIPTSSEDFDFNDSGNLRANMNKTFVGPVLNDQQHQFSAEDLVKQWIRLHF